MTERRLGVLILVVAAGIACLAYAVGHKEGRLAAYRERPVAPADFSALPWAYKIRFGPGPNDYVDVECRKVVTP